MKTIYRSFMREKGRKREGQRNALPPQIFNAEENRGVRERGVLLS